MRIRKEQSIQFLYKMMLIREFENAVSKKKNNNELYGSVHCYNGEEAVAVGICSALKQEDYIISNHRPHGHALAKNVDPKAIMAEIYGKQTGTNGGRGGSMHIHDKNKGLINSTGIVASGLPIACGTAFSSLYLHDERITCVFFGDGSANEGILHECLNISSVLNLPIIYVLEDNGLAVTTLTQNTSKCRDYVSLARCYDIPGICVDGQDVEAVYWAGKKAEKYVRDGKGPYIIQCKTIRFHEHAEGQYYLKMIPTKYRDFQQLEYDIINKCPISLYSNYLIKNAVMDKDEINQIYQKVIEVVIECIEFAENSENPLPESAIEGVFK